MDKEEQKKLIIEIMNEDAKDGLYKKQTAVEWLVDEIEKHYIINNGSLNPTVITELKRQAKEMEKEQIIEAYRLGHVFHDTNDFDSPEQYYEEEYGGNK